MNDNFNQRTGQLFQLEFYMHWLFSHTHIQHTLTCVIYIHLFSFFPFCYKNTPATTDRDCKWGVKNTGLNQTMVSFMVRMYTFSLTLTRSHTHTKTVTITLTLALAHSYVHHFACGNRENENSINAFNRVRYLVHSKSIWNVNQVCFVIHSSNSWKEEWGKKRKKRFSPYSLHHLPIILYYICVSYIRIYTYLYMYNKWPRE